ncbi:sulfotransferase [Nevskia sp.]|uniref:sulfotransferase n=1 Tax=Nevskia sp. TaxID=1929292 RepID=UPI0025FAA7EC|nr:sulfotransferase [Nevskia sp.]
MLEAPLLIVAPPGAHAARLAAMLGQHSRAQDLPELNLFMAATVGGLNEIGALSDGLTTQGLRRAVAALYLDGQTDAGIAAASRWLARRADWTGAALITEFALRLAPKVLVSVDAAIGWRPDFIDRLLDDLPDVRLLHLVEHPRRWCQDTMAALADRLFVAPDYKDYAANPPALDPQLAWFRVHANLAAAGALLPDAHYRVLRIEDLLTRPEAALAGVCDWLGWSANPGELDAMQQPERSPFAAFGPDAALCGTDAGFLADPGFARRLRLPERLDGPLEWRSDQPGFAAEVLALASRYDYQ